MPKGHATITPAARTSSAYCAPVPELSTRVAQPAGAPPHPGRWLAVEGRDLTTLEIGGDDRSLNPPCVRCGELGTQLHHWAPSAIFGGTRRSYGPPRTCAKR